MILNHLWGIYAHPVQEWHSIQRRHEGLGYSLTHILIIALLPSAMAYYSCAELGWSVGVGDAVRLTQQSAMSLSLALYAGLITGVLLLAYIIQTMGGIFDTAPSYTQSLELAAYTATPLFMVGLAAFYPELWVMMVAGLMGLSYSVYLLYAGTPIVMRIPEDKGFIYASSVVTAGLCLLVILVTSGILLLSLGISPEFS